MQPLQLGPVDRLILELRDPKDRELTRLEARWLSRQADRAEVALFDMRDKVTVEAIGRELVIIADQGKMDPVALGYMIASRLAERAGIVLEDLKVGYADGQIVLVGKPRVFRD